jgi:hypothetical protein
MEGRFVQTINVVAVSKALRAQDHCYPIFLLWGSADFYDQWLAFAERLKIIVQILETACQDTVDAILMPLLLEPQPKMWLAL